MKYYDFKLKVKNFSAKFVVDSSDLRMYDDITYRNGIDKSKIGKDKFKNLMIHNLKYLDIISEEDGMTEISYWLKYFIKTRFAISITNSENKIIDMKIRFFNVDDAFKFKIQFYNFICEEE